MMGRVHLFGALFAGSIVAFCLDQVGLHGWIVAVAGSATCGWSWLLTRALFRRDDTHWPLAAVLAMLAIGLVPLGQMGGNAMTLISSTALLLALVEPMLGYRKDLPAGERWFRIGYAAIYGVLMGVSVIGQSGKVVCALVALVAAAVAVWYRGRHPLPEVTRKRRAVSDDDRVLGDRILGLMREGLYAQPEIKVADLARRVGEAEYRVTQCITGALGFRNFNHMVNQFRISRAQDMLSDPACDHLPVLTIALDCGFGSIGPFNRAFKAQCDATPTAFREARRGIEQPAFAAIDRIPLPPPSAVPPPRKRGGRRMEERPANGLRPSGPSS